MLQLPQEPEEGKLNIRLTESSQTGQLIFTDQHGGAPLGAKDEVRLNDNPASSKKLASSRFFTGGTATRWRKRPRQYEFLVTAFLRR